eukprot:4781523-Amphidinium_carterae.1
MLGSELSSGSILLKVARKCSTYTMKQMRALGSGYSQAESARPHPRERSSSGVELPTDRSWPGTQLFAEVALSLLYLGVRVSLDTGVALYCRHSLVQSFYLAVACSTNPFGSSPTRIHESLAACLQVMFVHFRCTGSGCPQGEMAWHPRDRQYTFGAQERGWSGA